MRTENLLLGSVGGTGTRYEDDGRHRQNEEGDGKRSDTGRAYLLDGGARRRCKALCFVPPIPHGIQLVSHQYFPDLSATESPTQFQTAAAFCRCSLYAQHLSSRPLNFDPAASCYAVQDELCIHESPTLPAQCDNSFTSAVHTRHVDRGGKGQK